MRVDSLKVCHAVGIRGVNSTQILSTLHPAACDLRAPHIIPVNIITPMILTRLPEELTTFHVDMTSG